MHKITTPSAAPRQIYDASQAYSSVNEASLNLTMISDTEWEIAYVGYDYISLAFVTVNFSSDGWLNRFSRTYQFDCPGTWSDTDALNAILALSEFANSNLVTN